ncbi:MAG: PSD1 domain-containing protein [Verrucomicrobia bacterium]|nr:PSD1 domain-containing protein [Verrucomicrobiota bacterium]
MRHSPSWRKRLRQAAGLTVLGLGLGLGLTSAASLDPAQVEFFENKIRPLLADHCYECHSARSEKAKGGLLLDTRAQLLKGGTSGVVLVPGKPEESLLIQVLKGTAKDVDAMPPEKAGGPLKPEQIAVLEEWVRMGAPDPRTGELTAQPNPAAHWAFQPPRSVPPPVTAATPAGMNPIDAFIGAKLAEKGLSPAPRADQRTLLRRLTFDLTGLPPTPEEMQEFLNDPSPRAYAAAVDRLLASPRYGERWGRHWLDVARYADSKGYVFEQERRFSHSYTYRDWVVNALNQDLPYDQFLIQQIAGDQVATPDNPWPMAAQGFLTLGRRFLDNIHDIIDDRIDVVTRGTMGLTVACARCHDHKYDPVPTGDYYALYGVFNSSQEPGEKPLLGPNPNAQKAAAYERDRAERMKELQEFRAERTADISKKLRERVGDYLLAAQDSMGLDWTNLEGLARVRSLDPGLVGAWKGRLEQWQGSPTPAFGPWFALAKLNTNDFAAQAPATLASFRTNTAGTPGANAAVLVALSEPPLTSFKDVADRYGKLLLQADQAWSQAVTNAQAQSQAAPTALPDPAQEELRLILNAPDSPVMAAMKDIDRFFDTPTGQKIRGLQRKLDELDATHPGAPLRAMAYLDKSKPVEPVVFKRGNPGNPGPQVRRQFLEVIAGTNRVPFAQGSGRLELAQAIASRENPLTARVLVNRVWLRHFGAPLVRTPSDFGVRSDPPSHPELLDHLAVWFMDHGWSLKALHRYLLLSATYQQASDPGEDPAVQAAFAQGDQVDPANVLLWRMNRKRADFEALRDGLLAVSGRLDGDIGGQPVPMFEDNSTPRRTLYGFIDRQNLPGILRAFDFASPDATSPLRFQTTTPQQALFLMNSAFMADRARDFVSRPDVQQRPSTDARIQRLYELAFQRTPSPQELTLAEQFVSRPASAPPEPPSAVWKYGTGRFDTNSGRVLDWKALPQFTGEAWQWEGKLPAGNGQWTMLNRQGGHPGSDAANAAIRRWTAPTAGKFKITGTLEHPAEAGDGVMGRVVSSRQGQLQEWDVYHRKQATTLDEVVVEAGETLDFVVEPKANENSDGFNWAPTVRRLDGQIGALNEWRAGRDFSGPQVIPVPLNPWQQYAQVLLSANEFIFID